MASITQYTGSRYVPVFADPAEWNSTRTYEPLTIVLNEGNSYTSRQFVPVGVELTNTDYWLETGNYNAQVEQYYQQVLTYNKNLTTFFVTPEMYGAVGDGVTDDTDAIQKALNTSRCVFTNGKTYYITSTIFFNNDAIGNGATIKVANASNFTAISAAAPNALTYGCTIINKSGITVDNLNFVSDYVAYTDRIPYVSSTQLAAITITDNGDNSNIRNCTATYFQGHSFLVWGHAITNCLIENCKAINCGIGISMETRNDTLGISGNPTNITFNNCYNSCNIGGALSAFNGCVVTNCYFESNGNSATQINVQEVNVTNLINITGCTFTHTGIGYVAGTSRAVSILGQSQKQHICFNSCKFEFSADGNYAGIYINATLHIKYVNCIFYTNMNVIQALSVNIDSSTCEITDAIYFINCVNDGVTVTVTNSNINVTSFVYKPQNIRVQGCIISATSNFITPGSYLNSIILIGNSLDISSDRQFLNDYSKLINLYNIFTGNVSTSVRTGVLINGYTNTKQFPTNVPYSLAYDTTNHKLYICTGSNWYDTDGNLWDNA